MMLLLLASGCRAEETPFPVGMEPLEENTASCPDGSGSDPYPEEIGLASGTGDDFYWAHGCAYLHFPAVDAWEAFQDPDVVVDRRRIAEWSAEYDVEQGYDYSMLVHHLVRDLITVEYDITWRHALVDGETTAPEIVAVRWQKTYGASIIHLLEGSAVLRAVDDDVTRIELIEHLEAPREGPEALETFMTDLHADMVAFANGHDLPEYD
jgi:hypothetical protein